MAAEAAGTAAGTTRGGSGCGTTLIVVLLVLFLFGGIGFFLTGTPSSSIAKSTVAREALPSNAVTETGYYTDADGDWIHDQSELTAGLRKFYQGNRRAALCVHPAERREHLGFRP